VTPAEFAKRVLVELRLPVTDNNVTALVAFQVQEGGHTNGAYFNPLNTMRSMPGGREANLQVKGIKAYSSWSEGITATAKTMAQDNMKGIVLALARNASPMETLRAISASPWGWQDKSGRPIPFAAAENLVRAPQALARYASQKYRDVGGISGEFGSLFGSLPIGTLVIGAAIVAGVLLVGYGLYEKRNAS
jgi:hypothetical protein